MRYLSIRTLIKRFKAIKYMMKDKSVKKRKKALVIFGIAYLLFPVDIIPTFIPIFGILDDLILWIFIFWHLNDTLKAYEIDDSAQKVSKKKYKDKVILDGKFEEIIPEEEQEEQETRDWNFIFNLI